jgi:hypothetical protein
MDTSVVIPAIFVQATGDLIKPQLGGVTATLVSVADRDLL